jgi:hypothetical protein
MFPLELLSSEASAANLLSGFAGGEYNGPAAYRKNRWF